MILLDLELIDVKQQFVLLKLLQLKNKRRHQESQFKKMKA